MPVDEDADQNKCTCPTRISNGASSTTDTPRTITAATRSGPRHNPSQLLRRDGLMSDPPTPINFSATAGTGNLSKGKSPAGVTPPPPSWSPGVDRSRYTLHQASHNHLPSLDRPRQSARPRPNSVTSVPSISDAEDDGQIRLDYPAQPHSAAWDSGVDTVVDAADGEGRLNAANSSANPGVHGTRKRRRANSIEPRRTSQASRQQRRREARSPPPSPSLSPPPMRHPRPIVHEADMIGRRPEDLREEEHWNALQGNALDLLERSHESLRSYLASYFDSNKRLRAELVIARRGERRAELRLAEAERQCIRYQVELAGDR